MEGESAVNVTEFSAYIFDLDGTLVTIPVDWGKVREEVGKIAGSRLEEGPIFQRIEELLSVHPSIRQTVFNMIDAEEARALPGAAAVQGAVELVGLMEKSSPLGLVTMQGLAACDKVLGRFRLSDLFDAQVTREDSLDRAVQLRLALETLGAEPRETLFTGDRMNDVVCGKKAGVSTALVGKEAKGDVLPDFSFQTLSSLRDALAR